MNGTAISDEERVSAAFIDVVFDDPDLVDMEFEAIIAGSWHARRATATPQRPGHRDSPWVGIRFAMSPTAGESPPLVPRSTIRSPPEFWLTYDPERRSVWEAYGPK